MTTAFGPLGDTLEGMVDAQFGERVRLLPYREADGGYTAPVADSSRNSLDAVAYILGRGTFMKGEGELTRRRASADWLMAIRDVNLVNFKKNDRVILLDRDVSQQYEMSYLEDSSNGRQKVHLLKVKQ